jgi:hypothetical protein
MGNLFLKIFFGSDGGFYKNIYYFKLKGGGVCVWGLFIYLYLRGVLGVWSGDDFFWCATFGLMG